MLIVPIHYPNLQHLLVHVVIEVRALKMISISATVILSASLWSTNIIIVFQMNRSSNVKHAITFNSTIKFYTVL